MKKLIALFLTVISVFTISTGTAQATTVSAQSAIVIESTTGRVLYEKNAFQKLPMASTTKIMTAILAIENCNLDETVTVGKNASGIEGSSIWLSVGEKMKVSELLFGMMLASGNDAAMALAEHVAGSKVEFAAMMNAKAKELGAYNTNFMNPNGLPNDNHYSTAYDMALISAYAMSLPYFCEVVKTQYKTLPWEGHEWERVVKNKNKILWQYEGGNGIKTGYTKAAGRCLCAAANREDMQLVSVVLNAPDMFGDSMDLLTLGFDGFDNMCILEEGEFIGQVEVEKGTEESFDVYTQQSSYFPLTEEEKQMLEKRVFLEPTIKAPVLKGQEVGYVDIWMGDTKIYSHVLKAPETIGENSYKYNLDKVFDFWLNNSF